MNWTPETPTLSDAVALAVIVPETVPVEGVVIETIGGVVSPNTTVLKVAVTVVFALTVTVQLPVPEHPPPDQPANVDPLVADAVSVTDVPEFTVVEHVAPQLIAPPLTVPEPVPVLVTERE